VYKTNANRSNCSSFSSLFKLQYPKPLRIKLIASTSTCYRTTIGKVDNIIVDTDEELHSRKGRIIYTRREDTATRSCRKLSSERTKRQKLPRDTYDGPAFFLESSVMVSPWYVSYSLLLPSLDPSHSVLFLPFSLLSPLY
jgi:hypothetical protein